MIEWNSPAKYVFACPMSPHYYYYLQAQIKQRHFILQNYHKETFIKMLVELTLLLACGDKELSCYSTDLNSRDNMHEQVILDYVSGGAFPGEGSELFLFLTLQFLLAGQTELFAALVEAQEEYPRFYNLYCRIGGSTDLVCHWTVRFSFYCVFSSAGRLPFD